MMSTDMDVTTPITADSFRVFFSVTTGATGATGATHIYDINDTLILKKIVSAYVNSELADGDHDLQRLGDQTNPLIQYCQGNKGGESYINGVFVELTINYTGSCTSQSAIKKNMEKHLMDKNFGNRLPLERKSVTLLKSLEELQQHLVLEGSNGFGRVGSSVVETHRGGRPNNNNSQATHSIMYKSQLTTTFDLPSTSGFIPLNFTGIAENIPNIKNPNGTLKHGESPVLRFYPNYFPNAFSIFILRSELREEGKLLSLIAPYCHGNNTLDCSSISRSITSIVTQLEAQLKQVSGETIYLLHMFSETIEGKKYPTFSLQSGLVKADDVTMQLYGEKKRSIVGCFRERSTAFEPKGIIFEEGMSFEMKCCHTLYGKTCGDGVTIEAANMFSYIHKSKTTNVYETTNVLSNDFCCNLRASYVTGFSTNQAQTKNAGTGLGFLSKNRNVEFFQSASVSGGKPLKQIYADNIVSNNNKHQFNADNMKQQLKFGLNNDIFLDYCVSKFIDKKMNELGDFLNDCKTLIESAKERRLINNLTDKKLFEKVGRFNFSTIKAEVEQYKSSFEKMITNYDYGFYKIFFRSRTGVDINAKNIENGISYISSIEEKLKECGFKSGDDKIVIEQQDKTLDNSNYKEIVFVFLSTYLSGIGEKNLSTYSGNVMAEMIKIVEKLHTVTDIDRTTKTVVGELLTKLPTVINSTTNVGEFYKSVLKAYNKNVDGIHTIQPEKESYPYKCELKQRINLLKFILRFQEFDETNTDKNDKQIISKLITSKSTVEDLNSKLNLVNYKNLQDTYESPRKTPQGESKQRYTVEQGDGTNLFGEGEYSQPPKSYSEPSESIQEKSEIGSHPVSEDIGEDTCEDTDEDIEQVMRPIGDSDDESHDVITNIFVGIIINLGSLFESKSKSKILVSNSNPEEEAQQILNHEINTAIEKISRPGVTEDENLLENAFVNKEIGVITQEIRTLPTEKNRGLLGWLFDTFYTKKRETSGETTSPNTTNKNRRIGGQEYGGSRKKYKKTKKFTRRKNKKSPKRKTIKKRKMPKRKNKTRRNK